jgi:hypothetical protein
LFKDRTTIAWMDWKVSAACGSPVDALEPIYVLFRNHTTSTCQWPTACLRVFTPGVHLVYVPWTREGPRLRFPARMEEIASGGRRRVELRSASWRSAIQREVPYDSDAARQPGVLACPRAREVAESLRPMRLQPCFQAAGAWPGVKCADRLAARTDGAGLCVGRLSVPCLRAGELQHSR